MELWDSDYLDLDTPAYARFEKNGSGEFRFGSVNGAMDCQFGEKDGLPLVEFSWDGHDDNDPVSGRGWAVLDRRILRGRFFIHFGDNSAFSAERWVASAGNRQRA